MRKSLLIGLFSIAAPALAGEWFVPRATHVRITNPTANAVTVDLSGATILLGPGETHETSGAVRITSHDRLEVSAAYRSTNAIAAMPVLDASDALDAGFVPLARGEGWESTVGIINPHDVAVAVTIDGRSIEVPANATRHLEAGTGTFTATRPMLVFVEDVHRGSGARLLTKARSFATAPKRRSVRVGPVPLPEPQKQTVTLTPSKDATLFEISNGSLANGEGVHLFAGNTNANAKRRALVHFDLASQIPAGSKVTSVSLTMQVSMTISGADAFRLHRVTTDWSEGASNAGDIRDGAGVSARTGDATWLHTSFNTRLWTNAGGDFNATADATTSFGSASGTWPSSPALVARVQGWVDQPATNFGWMILGNEAQFRSAKRFDSSEISGDTKPRLVVEFTR
jgi:hypothetical protein